MTQSADTVPIPADHAPEPSPGAIWQLSPRVCRITRFLGERASGDLLDRAISIPREELAPSRVRNNEVDPSTRRSRTRHRFKAPELTAVMDTLHDRLGQVLGISVRGTRPRYLLNIHNDGDFYRPHQDVVSKPSADIVTEERVLTFVYYLHRAPRPYTGGALRIFDAASPVHAGYALKAEDCTYRDWAPDHDSIIFFRPTALHEVRPVRCPSGEHADSRFAINGWLCLPHDD